MHKLVQLALDFLPPRPEVPAAGPQRARRKPPLSVADPEVFAPPKVASRPLSPASSADLAGGLRRHPQANRETVLEGVAVAFLLRRGRRRSIGFSISADGLVVSAPAWVPLYEVDAALQAKSAWVVRKLQEVVARQHSLQAARIVWQDGASLPYLGGALRLVLAARPDTTGAGAQLAPAAGDGAPRCLHLGLPAHATAEQIRDTVQAWLMRQARQLFTERLQHFAPLLGVQWRKLSLSSAGTRWGSASSNGAIRLHWRLIHFSLPTIDYVVAHELSHLRVMDHSPRFWDTVATLVPDYAERRQALKQQVLPPW